MDRTIHFGPSSIQINIGEIKPRYALLRPSKRLDAIERFPEPAAAPGIANVSFFAAVEA
jgi:hypothetical protein